MSADSYSNMLKNFTTLILYTLVIKFAEQTGGAYVIFKWSYSGQATEVVPSTAMFYPEYVASSPVTVTVT